jgi:hypothetical protein
MTVKPKYGVNPTFSRVPLEGFRLQLLVMGRAAHDCALPSRLAELSTERRQRTRNFLGRASVRPSRREAKTVVWGSACPVISEGGTWLKL